MNKPTLYQLYLTMLAMHNSKNYGSQEIRNMMDGTTPEESVALALGTVGLPIMKEPELVENVRKSLAKSDDRASDNESDESPAAWGTYQLLHPDNAQNHEARCVALRAGVNSMEYRGELLEFDTATGVCIYPKDSRFQLREEDLARMNPDWLYEVIFPDPQMPSFASFKEKILELHNAQCMPLPNGVDDGRDWTGGIRIGAHDGSHEKIATGVALHSDVVVLSANGKELTFERGRGECVTPGAPKWFINAREMYRIHPSTYLRRAAEAGRASDPAPTA